MTVLGCACLGRAVVASPSAKSGAVHTPLSLQNYVKAVRGGVKRGDVCYGMLRAAACVDESDRHGALMYAVDLKMRH